MKKSIEIVIVDDQEEMIDSIRPFFDIRKNIILKGTAISGKTSMKLIQITNPDVVLMDIKMESPKAGIKTTEKLLAKGGLRTKFIFFTAYTNIEDIKKAIDLGCSFIDKKCSTPRVMQIIEDVVYLNKLIVDIHTP